MKKIIGWFLGILLLGVAALYIFDYSYILKGIRVVYLTGHTTAFIDDFEYFETETIHASPQAQPWPQHRKYNTIAPTSTLDSLNKELGTIAFLLIKNDSIIYEKYAEGYGPDSETNSFSMAKSIVSAMLGKAIQEGYITGLDQPVADFYPQFQNTGLTVGDLSSMASGLNWDESYQNPFGMTARAYYDDNLAETILSLEIVGTPGKKFEYLSGNTQLLAMVIQKAIEPSSMDLATYLSEKFWKPMGAHESALWQVDDPIHELVKAYCCIGSNARDFARFGKLYKNFGKWNGQQLLDSSFVAKSITPRFEESPEYGYGFWLSNYREKEIFVMRGILGQYVITIPEDDLIIVRLGHNRGKKGERPFTNDFYYYIDAAYQMLSQEI
ncbi:MAG: serine hydrolase [Flavobacteriaceae bacterium]|nr:serine hydrolase [Flavobacteriaceae bacterium]